MLFDKALKVYKNEGLLSVITSAFRYFSNKVLLYETYYLVKLTMGYKQTVQKRRADFADEITSRKIVSNVQADEIAREYEDFRPHAKNARRILDAGGIAICIYVGKELASYAWIATSKNAMKVLSHMPMYVDFDNKEFYVSYDYTIPKYRRKGLRYYKLRHNHKIFKEMGLEFEISAVRTNNYAVIKANSDRPEQMVYAKVRLFKLLGMRFWKETPMNTYAHELADRMDTKSKSL